MNRNSMATLYHLNYRGKFRWTEAKIEVLVVAIECFCGQIEWRFASMFFKRPILILLFIHYAIIVIACQQYQPQQLISDRLQPRRRQSQATLLSHKQSLLTGSANSHFASPYNQFYLTNNVNSPHNVISSILTGSLISPLSLKETCTTASDNRAGICIPKKACLSSGGYVAGTCGILGSCCVYQGTCRTIIAANETYFVSPAFPSMHKERLDPPICIFTLQRSPIYNKWPVCQFRLSFDEFSLAPPINGTCGGKTDSFIVSGAVNFNTSGLPTAGLCGDMSGQHSKWLF